MPSRAMATHLLDAAAVASFQKHLAASTRIVAVLGAGLSASSGLATFRDANGLWGNHDIFSVSSPEGWHRDPGLVWQYYAERRRRALHAKPNPAHSALVELGRRKPGFVALSQNVDGLLQRAGMRADAGSAGQLKLLHGNLFDLVCAAGCGYEERDNFEDPPRGRTVLTGGKPTGLPAADANTAVTSGIDKSALPHCPRCMSGLLRPRVVWFGEGLPGDVMNDVDALFDEDKIDLCLVIGTSGEVWPAAGFAEQARNKGAKVAWINKDIEDTKNSMQGDWVFVGDAAVTVPVILGGHQHRALPWRHRAEDMA